MLIKNTATPAITAAYIEYLPDLSSLGHSFFDEDDAIALSTIATNKRIIDTTIIRIRGVLCSDMTLCYWFEIQKLEERYFEERHINSKCLSQR